MPHLLQIKQSEQLATLPNSGLSAIAPELLIQHRPDAHWALVEGDRLLAHCSLWWRQVPVVRAGLIGHYGAIDCAAAEELLHHAGRELATNGCNFAIAPIDGNTWRRYRAVCDRGSEPLFFLEPDNPAEWCEQFQAAGFAAIAHYYSAVNLDLSQQDSRLARIAARFAERVQIRSIDPAQLEAELDAIYQLSLISFQHNFLYTPIDRAEFLAQYRQVVPFLKPELVLMAEQDGQLVGFLFALPDLLEAKRGAIDTVIIKTVAVLPGREFAGLGSLLVARAQAIAQALGYTRAIHALMHETNRSLNLSRRYAVPMRRYCLFGRSI
ncbi:GNAT family N-acetyltransferase [Microcoleus sp. FACHB-1515]|uniref:GNAT family N-acetyltransferase n=1 Tax=Cyanophyceae TaxID=3028117 RepID=UPI001687C70A|nr:GNAT family N-acetyltransferase [Microcoleus sp. FACHB-1515]MBD2090419.1 GNAT family N-acetyltransferase [Microcoleus sp. FACHB-1515]